MKTNYNCNLLIKRGNILMERNGIKHNCESYSLLYGPPAKQPLSLIENLTYEMMILNYKLTSAPLIKSLSFSHDLQ